MADSRSAALHRTALAAWLGLIALTLAWEGWLAPDPHLPPGFWLALKAVPLLIPLFGLLHGRLRPFGWAGLLILAYFAEGVVVSMSHRRDGLALDSVLPYALLETALALVFFVSATLFIRAVGKAARAG